MLFVILELPDNILISICSDGQLDFAERNGVEHFTVKGEFDSTKKTSKS